MSEYLLKWLLKDFECQSWSSLVLRVIENAVGQFMNQRDLKIILSLR